MRSPSSPALGFITGMEMNSKKEKLKKEQKLATLIGMPGMLILMILENIKNFLIDSTLKVGGFLSIGPFWEGRDMPKSVLEESLEDYNKEGLLVPEELPKTVKRKKEEGLDPGFTEVQR